jgi:signal transduction histidine kinase
LVNSKEKEYQNLQSEPNELLNTLDQNQHEKEQDKFFKVEVCRSEELSNYTLMAFFDISAAKSITEANMSKSLKHSLLNSFSHELKTPLNNSITVLASGLNDTSMDMSSRNKYFHNPLSSLNLLNLMINNIIDFLKIDVNQLHMNIESFSVRGLLNDVWLLLDSKIRAKRLELQIIDDIPQVHINGDRDRLLRVLVNFVLNCLKYTHTGLIKIGVALKDIQRER